MKLVHVGIVVSAAGGIGAAANQYKLLGYTENFTRRRKDPWIGELVGIPGADIEIMHLHREGDPVGIELLAYWKPDPGPRLGIQHLCYEVEDLDAALTAAPYRNLFLRGRATIPDGPYAGTKCAYLGAGAWRLDNPEDTFKVELIQKPK